MSRAGLQVQEQLKRVQERLDAIEASVAAVHRDLLARPPSTLPAGTAPPVSARAPPPRAAPPPPPLGGRRAQATLMTRTMGYMAELKQVLSLRRGVV
jgi:cell division septation protein DedD